MTIQYFLFIVIYCIVVIIRATFVTFILTVGLIDMPVYDHSITDAWTLKYRLYSNYKCGNALTFLTFCLTSATITPFVR